MLDWFNESLEWGKWIPYPFSRGVKSRRKYVMVTNANSIWVITEEPEDDISKSLLPSVGRRVIAKSFEISNDVLALHLEEFFKSFQMVLGCLPSSIDHFTIDEIQLNLVIN